MVKTIVSKYYQNNDRMSVKHSVLIFLILFLFQTILFAQSETKLFPSELLIQPFTANTLKPKIGFDFQTGKNELTLNIGTSIDILQFGKYEKKFSLGVELFNYTRLRQEANFHFPVDAVDYFFGINFGYKKIKSKRNNYGSRVRISHISAHLVDGRFNKKTNTWLDNKKPIVYSREFVEVISFYRFNNLRIYGGVTYIFSIDPSNIGQDQYQLGLDYFAKNLISKNLTPYFAYDFRLINLFSYTGNNSLEAGIKYGFANGKGVSLYLKYFAGYNIHGEYFNIREKYLAIGFNFDL